LLGDVFDREPAGRPHPRALEDAFLSGWSFACDPSGCYTACGPEVERVLGIPPEAFIGRSFVNFALVMTSAVELKFSLEAEKPPLQVQVDFENDRGEHLPAVLNVFATLDREGRHTGWHGFAYLVDAAPEKSAQEQADQKLDRLVQVAETLLTGLLDDLRRNSPAIQKARNSRVTRAENLVDSPGNGLRSREIRFTLEWGEKFDLSPNEKLFVIENRFAGKRDLFRRLLASSEIVKCDLFWIAAVIAIEGKDAWLLVDYPSMEAPTARLLVQDFLLDTGPMLAEIRRGIENPWYTRTVLQKGRDFLLTG